MGWGEGVGKQVVLGPDFIPRMGVGGNWTHFGLNCIGGRTSLVLILLQDISTHLATLEEEVGTLAGGSPTPIPASA